MAVRSAQDLAKSGLPGDNAVASMIVKERGGRRQMPW
jgi:hypothetical protein